YAGIITNSGSCWRSRNLMGQIMSVTFKEQVLVRWNELIENENGKLHRYNTTTGPSGNGETLVPEGSIAIID
ncbi:4826_t:CDS:1, partial [Entrophospora sp. SA101]